MKKKFSVFKLAARASFIKILGLMGITFMVQCILFATAAARVSNWDEDCRSLTAVLNISGMPFAALFCFLFICILLVLPWTDTFGSTPKNTLYKLNVSGKQAAVRIMIYNFCCFVILWCMQLCTYLLCSFIYLNLTGALNPSLQIFSAARSLFYFHNLLPLGDSFRIIVNIAGFFLAAAGTACAAFTRTAKQKDFPYWQFLTVLCSFIVIISFITPAMTLPTAIFEAVFFFASGCAYIIIIMAACAIKFEPGKNINRKSRIKKRNLSESDQTIH